MTHTTKVLGAFFLFSLLTLQAADTYSLFSTNATWRYRKGLSEASTPDIGAWRTNGFEDSGFTDAPAPFTYGENYTYGTQITDMLNSYSSIFLRRAFVLTNRSVIAALRLGAKVDDGFVAWINGTEVSRVNLGGASGDPVFYNTLSGGAPVEPVPFVIYDLNDATNYLTQGTNIIAVQVFNTTLNSSDLVFDASLDALLVETNPPVVASISPAAGNVSMTLTQVMVTFSESVRNVTADDLIINSVSATSVSGSGSNYTFTFPPPQYGVVYVTWAADSGIGDTAIPPNPFDGTAPSAVWQYNYIDTVPPTIADLRPAASTTVRTLGEVRVTFSEGVLGVNASDLLLDNAPATNVVVLPGNVFLFQFAPADAGSAELTWAAGHGITDVAPAPNPFTATSWSYTVDPNASLEDIVINEILAANATGLGDPIANNGDTDPLPWIELYNRGAGTIDLRGWSLSDDPDFPDKWVFPSRTLAPGQYLIVFASGLNITNATGTNRLHTSFKLSRGGEFVGLYSPDAPPTLVSGFNYPEQRNDYSHGMDSQGQLRYFNPPTPGAANGDSAIAGVVSPVHFNVSRGHFTQPFDLILSCDTRGTQIRYTTNGSEPTLTTGAPYQGTLRINGTIMIRAAAFRTNMLSSRITTHTYLFNLPVAQRSLPVISIVTDQNNLTGPSGIIGISNVIQNGDGTYVPANATGYHNPSRHGIAWERPTSVEFIRFPDNSGFQTEAGLRVQGSDYQRPRTTPNSKFSFRLYFRSVYGDGRLNYPLFPLGASQEHDQIVLRAGFNENNNPFIRDELTRRLSHDMGNVASHGTMASLFVNGVYKGFYNPCERVHEEMMQSYLGGSEDWDVVGPSFATGAGVPGVIDGDRTDFVGNLVNFANTANVNDPATYAELRRRLDFANFADYCLLNSYCAMGDWPQNNWRAGKDRGRYPWRFVVWDAEWAMGFAGRAVTLNTFTMSGPGPNEGGLLSTGDSEIARVYQALRASPEFRLLWADRVHKHMFNGGALTDENITNRFGQLRVEFASVFAMNTDIITSWVPQRRNILLGYMNPFGLLASSNAPVFSQFGGRVPVGFQLTMAATNGGGAIYYTTNGADPRVPFSGVVSNVASLYTGPVALNGNVLVKARTLSGGNWSALTEARFEVALLGVPVRITELHYNPSESPNYEFIELMNIGGAPADLSGATFEGISFTFDLGSILQPGQKIILATGLNTNAFGIRFPGLPVYGYYSGSLNNAGEAITLRDFGGNIITSVTYDDGGGWATAADGLGPSLEIIDPYGDPNDPANWRASSAVAGTPGSITPAPALGNVRLNEVLADNIGAVNHAGTFPDFVELANAGGAPVNIEGWSLTDDGTARKFVFPPGTTITAGGHLVIWCDDTTNTTPGLHSGFALGRNGDNVYLYDANTNLVDALTFGLQVSDFSVGRIGGAWTLTLPTTNAPNVAAALGTAASLSINEFLANPTAGADDWLELFNNSASPVALRGCFLATTTAVHQVTSLSFVPPFGFVQLIADENPGPDHLNFNLSAGGGAIVLYDITSTEVNRVTYGPQAEGISRGRLPDGTANIVNFPGTASPAASNYTATYTGPVLNEVLARNVSAVTNAGRVADFVELYNPNTTNFPLTGMSLSVNSAEAGQWLFPPGASIGAQSYLVIWCDGGLPASTTPGSYNTGESLDGESGGVYLFNAAGQLVSSVEYGFQVADLSVGLVNSAWRLLSAPTAGTANSAAASLGPNTALRINEWMADAAGGPSWFELFNGTNQPVDMNGLVLTDDPTISGTNNHRIAPLSFIAAGGFVQWIADGQSEQGRNHVNFNLDADGESLRLYASNANTIIDSVAFGAQVLGVSQGRWPDGATNAVSFPGSPTPGESNYKLLAGVVINEVLSHVSPAQEQHIELRNRTGDVVEIGGWYLSDNVINLKKLRFADGISIAPGGFITVSDTNFGTPPNIFTLDRARGGELWLSEGEADGTLTGYRTRVKFGAAAQGVSFGRYEAGGQVHFVAQTANTIGGVNAGPLVGPIVINEIMFNPPASPASATEFIELRNISGGAMDLSGWQLGDGVSFTFASGITLGAGGYLLVVDFDPVANPFALFTFQSHYGISPAVPVVGPYSGRLDNAGESIELSRPDLPDGAFVPQVLVDKVSYRDSAPWPGGATDGGGFSLQRRNGSAFGNDPANWLGAAPTAGGVNVPAASGPPVITQSPTNMNVLVNTPLFLQAAASGGAPLAWQWRLNGNHLPGETNSSLLVDYARLDDSGVYDVFVSNLGGPAFSAPAQITVVEPPLILAPPTPLVITNSGSNVTFSVSLAGSPPLSLQWKLDGTDVPGANSATLALTNLTTAQAGTYTFVAVNPYGTATVSAVLIVTVRPVFVVNPVPTTVLQGGTATFTAIATGAPPPWYRWLRNGAGYATNDTGILVITNVQANMNIRVLATNLATTASGVSMVPAGGVSLTVLPDVDQDGMADSWETNYFGTVNTTNNANNAVEDPDNDGMINRDEYVAGTNPTNALSLLKIIVNATNNARLEFVAQTNISYSVQFQTGLGATSWVTVTNVTALPSQVRTVTVDAPKPPPERERFYRVVTPAAP